MTGAQAIGFLTFCAVVMIITAALTWVIFEKVL